MSVFDYLSDFLLRALPSFTKIVEKSEIQIPTRDYVKIGVKTSSTTLVVLYMLSQLYFLTVFFNFPGEEILRYFVFFAPLSLIISLSVFIGFLAYPYIRKMLLSSRIRSGMLDMMTFLYALSASGANFDDIMFITSQAFDKKEALPFNKYLYYRRIMGWDLSKALKRTSERCPEDYIGNTFDILSDTIVSSGDISYTIETMYNKLLSEKRLELESKIHSLSFLSEIYISTMVVLPILSITMLVIISMVGGSIAGFNPALMATLVLYMMIPLALAFLVIVSSGE